MSQDLRQARLDKEQALREAGVAVRPERYEVTHGLADAGQLDDGTAGVAVAGRVMTMRRFGKLMFVKLRDVHGEYQLCLMKNEIGEELFNRFRHHVDFGDFVGARGETFTTRTGEKSLKVESWTFLGKALRPMPEKFHGLSDPEARQRRRYLDLIANADSRERLLLRSVLLRETRAFLDGAGFIEVETPVLQANPSGAIARPFLTHHNSLDVDLYLRIAPETYLKRLIVGGFTHIYEVARCFRNEGISAQHLQEFTMVEGYSAYWNYEDNIRFLQQLIRSVVQKMFGTLQLERDDGVLDLEADWERISMRELVMRDTGLDYEAHETAAALLAAIRDRGLELEHERPEVLGRGNLIDYLYKRYSRPQLVKPTVLVQHPTDLSPLARSNDDDPHRSDRFQFVLDGVEVVNAYSELVDPIEQARRLEQQAQSRAQGDEEAMVRDDDYVTAMEYGMPPISGWGFGVARLLQCLTRCHNIKDCVLFPLVRALPQKADADDDEG